MNKVLFFDFFGVICSEISPIWFRRHLDEETAKIVKEEIMSKADLGLISEEEVYDIISKRFNIPSLKIKEEWQELIKINISLVNEIIKLKETHKIILVSNAMSSFLNKILNDNNLYNLFDSIFISSELKLAKPDPKFFEYVINKEKLQINEIIFFDDNMRNVESAKKIGITSILYNNNLNICSIING